MKYLLYASSACSVAHLVFYIIVKIKWIYWKELLWRCPGASFGSFSTLLKKSLSNVAKSMSFRIRSWNLSFWLLLSPIPSWLSVLDFKRGLRGYIILCKHQNQTLDIIFPSGLVAYIWYFSMLSLSHSIDEYRLNFLPRFFNAGALIGDGGISRWISFSCLPLPL